MARYVIYTISAAWYLFAMSGCLSHHTERVADIDPLGWRGGDTIRVGYDNTDTVRLRKISLIFRYNSSFHTDTLRVVLRTVSPDSLCFEEKLRLPIAFTGIKRHDHFEAVVPYRHNNVLGRRGTYIFQFIPSDTYTGITAVGIKSD